jgi:hypothetical protein
LALGELLSARMAEQGYADGWHPARLIPAIGIRGQEEQEKRATSSLLAVMHAVPDFGHALAGALGAPKGRIATFTEVQLKDAAGKTHIPDGAIIVQRGRPPGGASWRSRPALRSCARPACTTSRGGGS